MIDLLIDDNLDANLLPDEGQLNGAVRAALLAAGFAAPDAGEPLLCLRFSDDAEIRALNNEWRNLDAPTDVLSFPAQEGPDFSLAGWLGDLIIALPYVEKQAAEMGMPLGERISHLVIHGVLHLVGFDHLEPDEAAEMEVTENRAMATLGLPLPWDESHG